MNNFPLKLYNTLSRKKEVFTPIKDNEVGIYQCGPTVYDYPHIGNLRSYISGDLIRRYLIYKGYNVKYVMNITDVGHLTSDADEGEDKLEKGAKREQKTVWEVAEYYTTIFKENARELNILAPTVLCKATEHIKEQIALIKKLEKNGYTYETSQAIYFDVSKFADYTKLSRQPLEEKITGARDDVAVDKEKRHPQDFALWFKRVGKFINHTMRWPSPWGEGFSGWHIECSAMSMKYLGDQFDIHIGGVDHIAVHHTNEIAQAQAATGKQFVKYWMHGEFLLVDGKKMAKSEGTFLTLQQIKEKGFSPLAFRLLCLGAHYRSKLNFTWDSLKAAQENLHYVDNSVKNMLTYDLQPTTYDKLTDKVWKTEGKQGGEIVDILLKKFNAAMDDDFNTPQALAVFFEVLAKTNDKKLDPANTYNILTKMNTVLGLGIADIKPNSAIKYEGIEIEYEGKKPSTQILTLIKNREEARKKKEWEKADEIRKEIAEMGYSIEDGETYIEIKKIRNIRNSLID